MRSLNLVSSYVSNIICHCCMMSQWLYVLALFDKLKQIKKTKNFFFPLDQHCYTKRTYVSCFPGQTYKQNKEIHVVWTLTHYGYMMIWSQTVSGGKKVNDKLAKISLMRIKFWENVVIWYSNLKWEGVNRRLGLHEAVM